MKTLLAAIAVLLAFAPPVAADPVTDALCASGSAQFCPRPAPTIVGCQQGFGPIETYWSDGRKTGWSQHCQDVHDKALEGERRAQEEYWRNHPQAGDDRPGYMRCGTRCGEPPTSGEVQMQHACEKGYAQREDCDALGHPFGG